MDLSAIVNYETLYDLEIRHPTTDEPIGIRMKIRSSGSKEAKRIQRMQSDRNLERLQQRKTMSSAQFERQELEKVASYIASWDWGDHTYRGEKPQCSVEKAVEILDELGWMFAQVVEAAEKVGNFSPASPPNYAKR